MTGKIYLTTAGSFAVAGVSGNGSDIFICTPSSLGDNTACIFEPELYWSGSTYGFGNEILDGFTVVE